MPPHPHLLPQVLHIRLPALLMVLVSLRPVLVIAQRVLATARPVPHTARQVRHIPPLRQHSARLLVFRPLALYTARQVHHTPLRVPTTIPKSLASNKVLRVRSTVPLVRWAIHLRALNSRLGQIRGPSVRLQAHPNGHLL